VSGRRLLVVGSLLAALAGASVVPASPASAVVRCYGACVAEVFDSTARPAGAIGLIGDSVLMGVDPWIAGDLAAVGWGPIHYWAGTGTRVPADNPLGASTVMRSWRAQGFDPAVWIIGVGADDVGFVGSSVAASEADIDLVLDEIGPDRAVVMATIQHYNAVWEANWNQALRNVAARRPQLHVVEWQAEADQHPSWWGGDGVHLSPTGYRARSQALTEATLPWRAADRVVSTAPAPAAIGAPAMFVPVTTTRVLDTRRTGGRLGRGQELTVDLTGLVPAGATAAAVNLTVDGPVADGYLSAYPCGQPPPAISSLNYRAGRPRGAAATVALDGRSRLCLQTLADTDVIVDVSGAYTPAADGARFAPMEPIRLLDTRTTGTVAAGHVAVVPLPSAAAAAVVNLTAITADTAGYLTAFRCGDPTPLASNVNYGPAETVANLAVVPAAADTTICIFASSRTDVVVDLLGTYGAKGLRYQAATPTRLLDTRAGVGGWSGRPAPFQVLDLPAVPGAAALSVTLTTVAPDGAGFTTFFPCGGDRPLASNLNYTSWSPATANAAVVAQPACVTAQARAHEVVDLAGWWTD
jgi:hypothetical protein